MGKNPKHSDPVKIENIFFRFRARIKKGRLNRMRCLALKQQTIRVDTKKEYKKKIVYVMIF